ncbi:MAG: TonB-dependent receptor [Calditrichia bacterium]
MRKHLFILMLNAMLICQISAQTAEIIGRIVEADDRPLIGANVYLEGTILGSATDNDGVFRISGVPEGRYSLVVNLIGYREYRSDISVSGTARIDAGTIELVPTVIANEPVVVTAGKYEQKIQDIPASISTVNQQELQARNITTIDQALAYVSGVNLNGGQLSIRGSTGYSRGAGSRVLMLIDGVPLLTADTRDIVFSVVPTYLLDHVEVLKGAGSAVYGSSAIGGVINVITRDIDDSPKFHLRTYGGVYSEPSHNQWKWTNDTQFTNGVSASYSRKINKIGVLAGISRDEDDGYQLNNWSRRWSGSGKLQWEMSPFRRLTLSGNYMHQERGNFLYWQDQQNALVPASGQEDDEVDSKRLPHRDLPACDFAKTILDLSRGVVPQPRRRFRQRRCIRSGCHRQNAQR